MTPEARHLARGSTFAVAAAAVLSTTAIFIRHLTETCAIPPLVLAFWRDVFVVATLLPLLAVFARRGRPLRRLGPGDLRFLFLYGGLLAAFNALWTLAVALSGAAIATVLVYTSGAFTAVLGWRFLGERLGPAKLTAVALALAGCFLVAGAFDPAAWRGHLAGLVTGVLSGLAYAVYSILGRAAAQRGLNPWTTILYTFGFAAVFLLAVNLVPGAGAIGGAARPVDILWLESEPAGWAILFVLAAGPTLLGYGLYSTSLVHLPSSVANLIVTMEPAFTAVLAFGLLGERLTGPQIAGSLLIVGGVAVIHVAESRSRAAPAFRAVAPDPKSSAAG